MFVTSLSLGVCGNCLQSFGFLVLFWSSYKLPLALIHVFSIFMKHFHTTCDDENFFFKVFREKFCFPSSLSPLYCITHVIPELDCIYVCLACIFFKSTLVLYSLAMPWSPTQLFPTTSACLARRIRKIDLPIREATPSVMSGHCMLSGLLPNT